MTPELALLILAVLMAAGTAVVIVHTELHDRDNES